MAVEARVAFRDGSSIAALSERYEQPWANVRRWVRNRG